jgi:hypothetical protein
MRKIAVCLLERHRQHRAMAAKVLAGARAAGAEAESSPPRNFPAASSPL